MNRVSDEVIYINDMKVRVQHQKGEHPLVVFASGCGLGAEAWRKVTPAVQGRWVAFDRPGLGGTPQRGDIPILQSEIALLREIIERYGDGGEVFLVAHSMAGFHAEALIRQHPGLVNGLLLVDSSVEDEPRETMFHERTFIGKAVSALIGMSSFFLGKEWRKRHRGSGAKKAFAAEWLAYSRQAAELLRVRIDHPWPQLQTSMITACLLPFSGKNWAKAQAGLASLLDAKQTIIRSRHNAMLDRPDVVIDAVETLRSRGIDNKDSQ